MSLPVSISQAASGAASDGTADALLAAARAMRADLSARAEEGEATCRLSPETVDAFRRAGLFRILQPRSFGGLEDTPLTLLRVQATVSEIDMSAGWVLANMGAVAFHLALFDGRAQDDVWGTDPDTILSSSNMPGGRLHAEADGTLSLSGQWRFSSGVDHADWVMLGALLTGDGEPLAGACVVPRRDIEIVEDWDVAGLRGTGSHAVRVAEARVPAYRFLAHAHRFHGTAPGLRVHAGPLYRQPLPQILFRTISTSSLGGLRGMLAGFLEANRERTSMMAQRIAEDPHVQDLCARIEADLAAQWQILEADQEDLARAARHGRDVPLARRRVFRLNATRVADLCFSHAADLLRAAGAAALYRGSPLLRAFNDMLAARQHAANQYELHARNDGAALFGRAQEDMLL